MDDSFNPRNVNVYSIEELIHFLDIGIVSFSDLQRCGLRWDKQAEVKSVLDNRVNRSCLYEELLADMRADYTKYSAYVMNFLFGKSKLPNNIEDFHVSDDEKLIVDFLKAGMTLTIEDLYRSDILPEDNRELEKAIFKPEFRVPNLSHDLLDELPTDSTDVFFLGVCRGGKSCVLSGILYYMHRAGLMKYLPMKSIKDNNESFAYYNAMTSGLSEYKMPQSISSSAVNWMKLGVGQKHDKRITVVETGGEIFMDPDIIDRWEWKCGISRCLKNKNPKILFFLIDYSIVIGKSPNYSRYFSSNQEQILIHTLDVLSCDGEGRYGELGCTMSKVKTVVVVITKSDLMDMDIGRPLTRKEREGIAFDYLHRLAFFMNRLSALCRKYGINGNNKDYEYKPFVTTFSLGQFYIGDTVVFDETDSKRLAEIIMASVE